MKDLPGVINGGPLPPDDDGNERGNLMEELGDFITGNGKAKKEAKERERLERLEKLTGKKQNMPKQLVGASFAHGPAFMRADKQFTGVENRIPEVPVVF